jgi:hypothetical protein
MVYSAFNDKMVVPDGADVGVALGSSLDRWCAIRSALIEQYPNVDEDWVYSGKSQGWALRFKDGKRTILYLTASQDQFRVGLSLGEKVLTAVLNSGLPAHILAIVEEAPRYSEGRGVRIVVQTDEDVQSVLILAKIKMSK